MPRNEGEPRNRRGRRSESQLVGDGWDWMRARGFSEEEVAREKRNSMERRNKELLEKAKRPQ